MKISENLTPVQKWRMRSEAGNPGVGSHQENSGGGNSVTNFEILKLFSAEIFALDLENSIYTRRKGGAAENWFAGWGFTPGKFGQRSRKAES